MNTYYHEFLLTILPDMIRIKAQCGSGVVVTREPSKLKSRVRFPSPVPLFPSHTEPSPLGGGSVFWEKSRVKGFALTGHRQRVLFNVGSCPWFGYLSDPHYCHHAKNRHHKRFPSRASLDLIKIYFDFRNAFCVSIEFGSYATRNMFP